MLLISRPAKTEGDNVAVGVFWMLVTSFFFVCLDALAKVLVADYPVMQLVCLRFVFHLLFAGLLLGPRLGQVIKSANPGLQLVRSLLLMVTTLLFFLGIRTVPLADASAISFTSPLWVAALSVPLLREAVGPRRWAGVAIGFLGALVIIRPGAGILEAGVVFLLCCAVTNACYQLATRRLRGADAPLTTLFYTALVGAVVTSLAAPFIWVPMTLEAFLLSIGLGLCGCLGHFTLIKAFQSAPAAVIAPFSYANLIWATGFGFILFGDLPDGWTLVGAVVIAASGLYILHREQLRKREAETA